MRESILLHYMIAISNPMVILQQEEAKKFFQVQNSRAMYDLFYKASSLKRLTDLKTDIAVGLKSCKINHTAIKER